MANHETELFLSEVKGKITKKQNQKMHELIIKTSTWIKYLENELKVPSGSYSANPKQKANAENILIALQSLTDVVGSKRGKLPLDTVRELKRCFGQNRNWGSAEAELLNAKEIICQPIDSSDKGTNVIVLCLLGIITDNGSHPLELIKDYIKR
jgi:hypothetical protein